MRSSLRAEVRFVARPEAAADADAALDLLADALAEQIIAAARAEVAEERDVPEETIDLEHRRFATEARVEGVVGRLPGDREP
ncbi:hypothetical protein L6R50_09030 [Myxococcota bacterium]|nr:hypothetical protein [Myxococcota bacterium]